MNTSARIFRPSICQYADSFFDFGDYVYASYYFFIPLCVPIAIIARLICLWAFYGQSTKEKAYTYQLYLIAAELFDTVAFTFFLIGNMFSAMERSGGQVWFQKSYILMFMAAHVTLPVSHTLNVSTLFLAVSMAADRVFACAKPFVYRNIRHILHQRVALGSSVLISFVTTFYNSWMFSVGNGPETYQLVPDRSYERSMLGHALANTGNIVRTVGLIALITCNVAVIRFHKRRMAHVATMIHGGAGKDEKKATERTLIQLTLCQSFFTSIVMFGYVAFYTSMYSGGTPPFGPCGAYTYGPMLNVMLLVCDAANGCATVVVNKKTRQAVKRIAMRITKFSSHE